MDSQEITHSLLTVLPPEAVSIQEADIARFSTDNPLAQGSSRPTHVVRPKDVETLQKLVRLANERKMNLTVASSTGRHSKGGLIGAGESVLVDLSPWDRNQPTYGDSPKYNEYFRNQLRELLTNYGRIDEVWFDGACGEGPNGKKQEYDWPACYALVRELQPTALIAICGPDIRWVGNESGVARENESSVVTQHSRGGVTLRTNDGSQHSSAPYPSPAPYQYSSNGPNTIAATSKDSAGSSASPWPLATPGS